MRSSAHLACARLAGLLLALFALCLAIGPTLAASPQVNVIRVDGVISPSSADYIVTAIKQAEKDKVAALVIELNTPGGLDTSMRSIIMEMLAAERPIVVYVAPSGARAASAGAFITLAAHIAAMAPGTNMGAASPVAMGGQMDKTMERKVTNDAAAYIRTIAEKRGRPIDLAEQWVRKATSTTETEALKSKLIDVVSPSLPDLLKTIDGRVVTTAAGKVKLETKDAVINRGEMNLREKILKIVTDPTIAYLLLILGLAGLYFEFSTPGAILPGVLGGICLILALYAFQQLPINYAGVLLILLGHHHVHRRDQGGLARGPDPRGHGGHDHRLHDADRHLAAGHADPPGGDLSHRRGHGRLLLLYRGRRGPRPCTGRRRPARKVWSARSEWSAVVWRPAGRSFCTGSCGTPRAMCRWNPATPCA